MSARLRIGVIFGGTSGEHDISLLTARGVLGAIDNARYDVVPIGISRSGAWAVGENVLERLSRDAETGRRQDGPGSPAENHRRDVRSPGVVVECRRRCGVSAVARTHGRGWHPSGPAGILRRALRGLRRGGQRGGHGQGAGQGRISIQFGADSAIDHGFSAANGRVSASASWKISSRRSPTRCS